MFDPQPELELESKSEWYISRRVWFATKIIMDWNENQNGYILLCIWPATRIRIGMEIWIFEESLDWVLAGLSHSYSAPELESEQDSPQPNT